MIRKVKIARNSWRIKGDVTYHHLGIPIAIPSGFETDGLSLFNAPRWLSPLNIVLWLLRLVVPRWHRKYEMAVLLHDYLYRKASARERKSVADALTVWVQGPCDSGNSCDNTQLRLAADRALLKLSTGWRRKPMYAFVRMLGEKAWQ